MFVASMRPHNLYTWLYENLRELVNYARGEVRAPRAEKKQLRGRVPVPLSFRNTKRLLTYVLAQGAATPIVPPICSASARANGRLSATSRDATRVKWSKDAQLINQKCTIKIRYHTRSSYWTHKYRECEIILLILCTTKNRHFRR